MITPKVVLTTLSFTISELLARSPNYDSPTEPGSVSGECQPSRWAVTLVDVHTLGALLGVGKEGYGDRY